MFYKFQIVCVILLIFVLKNARSEKIDELFYSENQNPDKHSIKVILPRDVRRSSLHIMEAIRKRDFTNAVQLIETNPRRIATAEWIPILQDIFNSEIGPESLLSELGKTMKFGTNKLMFYVVFKRFLNGKSEAFILSNGTRSDFEHKDFLNFEEEIMFLLERLFEESIIRNVDSEATKILQEIRWDKLAEEEASYLEHSTVIQHLFNATLEKIYFHLDVDKLIDQIQDIADDLENSKVYQVHLYGALRHAISVQNDDRYLFKLAYVIRDHIKNVRHETATVYFDSYLRSLLESFHGCIRNIVDLTDCDVIRISNVKYDEVLYDYSGIPAVTEIDLNQTVDDLIFTRDVKRQSFFDDFSLEFKENRFWISTSATKYKDCIDISHNTYVHTSNCTNYSWSSAIKISGSDQDNENCYIQNWNSLRYMYADSHYIKKYRARTVFSNGTHTERDASYLWNFGPYNGTSCGNNFYYLEKS